MQKLKMAWPDGVEPFIHRCLIEAAGQIPPAKSVETFDAQSDLLETVA